MLQSALDDSSADIGQLRAQLKEARERERRVDSANDVSLQNARAAQRQASEDLHAMAVQAQAAVDAKRLTDDKLALAETTILQLKAKLDREREKLGLQRTFLVKKLGSRGGGRTEEEEDA